MIERTLETYFAAYLNEDNGADLLKLPNSSVNRDRIGQRYAVPKEITATAFVFTPLLDKFVMIEDLETGEWTAPHSRWNSDTRLSPYDSAKMQAESSIGMKVIGLEGFAIQDRNVPFDINAAKSEKNGRNTSCNLLYVFKIKNEFDQHEQSRVNSVNLDFVSLDDPRAQGYSRVISKLRHLGVVDLSVRYPRVPA